MENLKRFNTRDAGIFIFIYGFITGIFLSSLLSINYFVSLFLVLVALVIFVSSRLQTLSNSRVVLLISIGILSIAIGSLRYEIKDTRHINWNLESSIGNKTTLEGLVISESLRKDNSTQLVVLPDDSQEKMLINTDLYNHANYGDRVRVSGKLQQPGILQQDDGRKFNYKNFLAKDDIYYTISFAKVEIISSGNGNFIKAALYKTKNFFIRKIQYIFPEPDASLLSGLILAGKESLPKNIIEEFRRAGIIHIVVLSGYNITILAEFFLKMFSWISLRYASYAAGGSIILFTLMTGAEATVVRAAIMGILLLLGKVISRGYSAPRALLLAGFLMLLHNPKILVFDPSFQLSFLATISLLFIVPLIEGGLGWITEKGGMRSIIATTAGTQLFVFPYILYSMGNFSVIALLSNILTLIFIPITMLVGFVATTISIVSYYLSIPFSFLGHLLLSWILLVGETLGGLTFASVEIKAFSIWILVVWYSVYACSYYYLKELKINRGIQL